MRGLRILESGELRDCVIREEGGKFVLYSKDGKKKLGTFDTKAEAEKREKQVQFFKYKNASGEIMRFLDFSPAAAESLAKKFGDEPGFFTRCTEHMAGKVDDEKGFCQWLKTNYGPSRNARALRGGRAGEVRTIQHDGREHLVVPVVALVEGVIHASNAETPELVLAEEFGANVQQWNGRPIMLDHPTVDGQPVLANDPTVLDAGRIGTVFNARVEGKKLKMDAYVDPTRLEGMGERGATMLAALRAGEMVEVSVGTVVEAASESGQAGGKAYAAVWRDITSDHLAFLPEGVEGACSIAMGCGTRAAADRFAGYVPPNPPNDPMAPRGEAWSAPSLQDFTKESWTDLSDAEKNKIATHFAWATETPANVFGDLKLPHHRASDGAAVFHGVAAALGRLNQSDIPEADKAKVRAHLEQHQREFEKEAKNASDAPCGCGGRGAHHASAEDRSMDKKARVAAIIASGKTCFKAADAAVLEQLSDEAIEGIEAKAAEVPKTETKAPTQEEFLAANPDIKAAVDAYKAAEKLTVEQRQEAFLKDNPVIGTIVSNHKAAQAARRADLVGKLKTAQKAYTEAELQALSSEQLEKVAQLSLKEDVSYEGAGAPRAAAGAEEEIPAPPSLSKHFRDANKKAAN